MIGTLLESMPENQENHECRIDIPTGGNAPALNLSIIEISSHTEASNVGPNEVQSNTGNSSPVWTGIRARFLQWLQYSWTHIEGVFTLIKIVACIVVLIVARHEKPKAPLFAWVVIYAVACASYLPVLYKYQILLPGRLFGLVNNYYTKTIDVIFVLWYIICSYWVFRYHATAAPNLLRLCTAFLTFGFIGYAMPFIGLAIVIYFNSGILDEINTASAETIRALPTYKFKLQRNGSRNMESDSEGEVGVVAAGTEKERVISGDDAVCCICLVRYADNDKLKELPCSHLFHSKCVDKWLKIKSICPLCKCSIGESNDG